MSDAPQGEGWWMASDGRWYPPSSEPAVAPTEGSTPAGPAPTGAPAAGPSAEPSAPWTPTPAPVDGGSGGGGGGKVLVGLAGLVVGALLGAGITWAATSGGDDGGDDWSAFCDRAGELEQEAGGEALSDEEGQAAFAELVALAPDDYQELLAPLEAMADGGSTEDLDAFGEAFGAVFYLAAILEVECGLDMGEDSMLGGGDMSFDSEGSFDLDDQDLGIDEGTDGTMDDLFPDDGLGDDPFLDEEAGPMDIDTIEAWLAENRAGEAWVEAITSWSVSQERDVIVSPSEPFTDDDALAACEGIAEYVFSQVPDGSVEVADPDGTARASATEGSACALVE